MPGQYAIGIDFGGTNIKAGLVNADGGVVARRSIDTEAHRGPEHVIARIIRIADEVISEAGVAKTDICALGIGAPGPMCHATGIVIQAPNLPGWLNVPLRDLVRRGSGLLTNVENDANAAAYGEFHAGAGKHVRDIVVLTLGTGIGGGIIIDGKLLRGRHDNAGEIGHVIVQPGGRPCPCGQNGCLERYASAGAIGLLVTEAIAAGEACVLGKKIQAGEQIDARDVDLAAAEGDPLCRRIWDQTCAYLAIACVNIQHTLNPDRIVLAGGLIGAGERLMGPVRAHFASMKWRIADDEPEIVPAVLGNDAGIVGAAALARPATVEIGGGA